MNPTHDSDREKARSLVHNLVFDPSNPDIANHPILNRKKEKEPKLPYDKQSLYLTGQSDRDLSQLIDSQSSAMSRHSSTHRRLL